MSVDDPDLALQQMRLKAVADKMMVVAERIEKDEEIDDATYTAGMLRLQATELYRNADEIEDGDDLNKVVRFVTLHELQTDRLASSLDKAQEAKVKATKSDRRWKFWQILSLVLIGISLLSLGFQIARAIYAP